MITRKNNSQKFTLKYPDKSMILFGYFILIFFFLLALQDILRDKYFYGNPFYRIIAIMVSISAGFGMFYLFKYRFGKRMHFGQSGISITKFLQRQKFFSWEDITELKFIIRGFSTSDIGTLGAHGVLALALITNMAEIGRWKVLIKGRDFDHKTNLYHIPFSHINYINPLIFDFSHMKYLNFQDLKDKKRKIIEWSWKLEGSEEEKSMTLAFLQQIPEELEKLVQKKEG